MISADSTVDVHQINEIRKRYLSLDHGESIVLAFKEHPKAVVHQLLSEDSAQFSYEILENGPEFWKLEIKKKKESCCGFCGG